MDSAREHQIENITPSEQDLLNQLEDIDRLSEYQVGKFRLKAKSILGEEWVNKLLDRASLEDNLERTHELWKVAEPILSPENLESIVSLMVSSKELAMPGGYIGHEMVGKIHYLVTRFPVVPNEEVIDGLTSAVSQIAEKIRNKEDFDGYSIATEHENIFKLTKAILLVSTNDVAENVDLYKNDDVYSDNLRNQIQNLIELMKVRELDRVKRIMYERGKDKPNSIDLWLNQEQLVKLDLLSDKEAMQTAVKLFEKDLGYMHQSMDGLPVEFRGLIVNVTNNDRGFPIVLIRPDDSFDTRKIFNNGYETDMHHVDVWRVWFELARKDPSSDRGKLFRYLARNRIGWSDMTHIYIKIEDDGSDQRKLSIYSDWWKYERDTGSTDKIVAMEPYKIDEIKTSEDKEAVDVAKIILESELNQIIDLYARRLGEIIPPSKVTQFRNLAQKYMKDPDADKSTRSFQIYQEYMLLAGNIRDKK